MILSAANGADIAIVDMYSRSPEAFMLVSGADDIDFVGMAAAETELPEAVVRDMAAMYDFDAEVTDADITAMSATVDFMVANGMIEEAIDVESLILPAD